MVCLFHMHTVCKQPHMLKSFCSVRACEITAAHSSNIQAKHALKHCCLSATLTSLQGVMPMSDASTVCSCFSAHFSVTLKANCTAQAHISFSCLSLECLNSIMTFLLPQLLCDACRVVLVGDPQQLPATVLSRQAQLANMERSMFER